MAYGCRVRRRPPFACPLAHNSLLATAKDFASCPAATTHWRTANDILNADCAALGLE
jgi:hypothetical protein